MTRDEYNVSVERLLGNIDRLHFDNRELVVVMSMDVYEAVRRFEQVDHLATLRHGTDTYGAYYGHRIGIVNDTTGGEVENMMEAALVGMTAQQTEVRIGDLLVISEDIDNRLYQMTTTDPVQFTDTGMVVAFDRLHHPTIGVGLAVANAADAAVTVWNGIAATMETGTAVGAGGIRFENGQLYINNGNGFVALDLDNVAVTTDATAGVTTRDAIDHIADAWNRIGNINPEYTADWTNAPVYPRGKRRKIVKEPDLAPGDTKLLDEFLDSFLRSGA